MAFKWIEAPTLCCTDKHLRLRLRRCRGHCQKVLAISNDAALPNYLPSGPQGDGERGVAGWLDGWVAGCHGPHSELSLCLCYSWTDIELIAIAWAQQQRALDVYTACTVALQWHHQCNTKAAKAAGRGTCNIHRNNSCVGRKKKTKPYRALQIQALSVEVLTIAGNISYNNGVKSGKIYNKSCA